MEHWIFESIPKVEREIANRGRRGGLKDVMISPIVAEKIRSDPAFRAKAEGSIHHYVYVERPDFTKKISCTESKS
ncbi:hypothetical protein [Paenibacillus sp. FSL H7-0331]|uniref:hypothetical protein n=1 Tax=Paenibacillus sp. FSL H7-0331 TaxID=1920421 RepID=UPI00096D117B|nr:hypothetical protein [Paenibacillus sp. FSL H7-0331]OMF06054.1 hypothetical protein BK127_31420 [Paenibacillus sp. FSL H7-0331]